MNQKNQLPPAKIKIESIQKLKFGDLDDLCDATESAITEGGGFGWIEVPSRKVLELIIGRLDNVVAGSCQLIKPSKNNEAQKNSCSLTTFFLAPWARGYGITPELIKFAENLAKNKGYNVITLDVRETQKRAIEIYEQNGFIKFGENPFYATVSKKFVKGYYYHKQL